MTLLRRDNSPQGDPAPPAEGLTEDEQLLAVCARIFSRRFDEGVSFSRIAEELTADGRTMSSETVRKIIIGETHAAITAGLRRRYPTYEPRCIAELSADQYERIFVDFHENRRSLSSIAADYGDGYDYTRIRRILQGDGEYAAPTAELRARFPKYRPREGRLARRTPLKPIIASAFRIYFKEGGTTDDVRAKTGIPKSQFKALVEGREAPEKTETLRKKYGSALRPAGRQTGKHWAKPPAPSPERVARKTGQARKAELADRHGPGGYKPAVG